MAIYFLMLSMPALFGLFMRRAVGWLGLLPIFFAFVFLVGFRYRVGMDWSNYEAIHMRILLRTPGELIFESEPLSNLLFWISKQYSDGTFFTNIFAATILLLGVFSLARRTANPWISIVAATPYLIVVVGMSGIRQGMAAGVFFFALSRWYQLTTVGRLSLVFVASLFHASAIVLAVLVIAEINGSMLKKIVLGVPAAIGGSYLALRSDLYGGNLSFYEASYLANAHKVESPGALFHIALVAFPASLFLVFRKSLFASLQNNRALVYLCISSLFLVLMTLVSSTGASRFSIYFQCVPMVVYPALTRVVAPRNRMPVSLAVSAFHFAALFVWLHMANNSSAWRQYNNLFFQ